MAAQYQQLKIAQSARRKQCEENGISLAKAMKAVAKISTAISAEQCSRQ
jgi:hypothetical protein